jgi:DNA-binding response OmpR family regulator
MKIVKEVRILVVDDNATFCASVERALRAEGYRNVRTASDGFQALELIREERPAMVLLDLYLPGMDGMRLLTAIHKIDKSIQVLMLTCEADEECIKVAAALGAADYLVKPFALTSLFSSLQSHLKDSPQQPA